MQAIQTAEFRKQLENDLRALEDEDQLGRHEQGVVKLDQQSVGRLSRMDALQRQAMAKATKARRGQARQRILAALSRIESGEFGYCTDCGESIPPRRLELDPTVPTCINCAGA